MREEGSGVALEQTRLVGPSSSVRKREYNMYMKWNIDRIIHFFLCSDLFLRSFVDLHDSRCCVTSYKVT